METNEKNTEGEKKSNAKATNPLDGIDFSKLLQNEHILELIKHLLSGGGAMAGSYFMWIKPAQDKIEVMKDQINKLDARITELENTLNEIIDKLNNNKEKNENLKGSNEELFFLKRNNPNTTEFQSKRTVKI